MVLWSFDSSRLAGEPHLAPVTRQHFKLVNLKLGFVRVMSQIYRITLRFIKDDRQWWSLTRCDVRAGGKLLLG